MLKNTSETDEKLIIKLYNLYRSIYLAIWQIFHKKMIENPITYIPKNTMYCYTFLYLYKDKSGYAIKACPFWKKVLGGDLCLYTGDDCLDDQCKTCGISDYEEFDEIYSLYER